MSRGLSDAIFLDYSPTSTIAGLQKPYLLVGLFTLEIIHFHLRFLTKQISWPLLPSPEVGVSELQGREGPQPALWAIHGAASKRQSRCPSPLGAQGPLPTGATAGLIHAPQERNGSKKRSPFRLPKPLHGTARFFLSARGKRTGLGGLSSHVTPSSDNRSGLDQAAGHLAPHPSSQLTPNPSRRKAPRQEKRKEAKTRPPGGGKEGSAFL